MSCAHAWGMPTGTGMYGNPWLSASESPNAHRRGGQHAAVSGLIERPRQHSRTGHDQLNQSSRSDSRL